MKIFKQFGSMLVMEDDELFEEKTQKKPESKNKDKT